VIVGVATTSETGTVTLRMNAVVRVIPPPLDVTVIGKFPAGVDPLVVIVSTLEQVGLQEEEEEKDPTDPEGRPETLKVIA
jgi:hypothetical protein